jgi:hypothetical protein
MDKPSPPQNAGDIDEAIDRALCDLELEPDESAAVLAYANRELSSLQTPETTYFVLGSYRDPYIRRLRTVADELNSRIGVYAYVLGDLPELDLDRLPVFEIRFHIVAAYTDTLVGVYEQGAGGEITELGKISDSPYFEHAHVLPRDYYWPDGDYWPGGDDIETRAELLAQVVDCYEDDELSESERDQRITELVGNARANGIDVDRAAIESDAQSRLADTDRPSYSWVHKNEFRLFDRAGRCHPWVLVETLREVTNEIP